MIATYTIIYHHIPSYTIIYHHIPSYTIIYQCSYMIFQYFAVLLCSVIFVPKKTGRSSRWPTFVLESCFLQSHHRGLTGKPCCAQHDWPRKFLASFGFIHDSYLKGFEILIKKKKKTSSDYWSGSFCGVRTITIDPLNISKPFWIQIRFTFRSAVVSPIFSWNT